MLYFYNTVKCQPQNGSGTYIEYIHVLHIYMFYIYTYVYISTNGIIHSNENQ